MGCSRLFAQLSFLIVFVLFFLSIGEIRAYTHRGGRTLLQNDNNASNSGKDLADTIRIDPLDNFNKYKGGFDITNKHYWSSTAFTGIYGYAVGAFWLLCGVLFGGYVLATTFCCSNRKKPKLQKRVPCSRQCYLWPIILGVSFTFLAIIISGVVIGGTTRFHSRAKTVIDIIIDTADGASNTIYNVTDAMRGISDNIALSNEGDRTSNFLNNTSQRLDKSAAELSRQAKKNRRLIDKGLKIVYITTVTIVSINMVAVIALSVCGFLRFQKAFYIFLILCWLLAALCWVSFGLYFFLEKFTGDTCTALGDFQQDPHNNSLSSIVPCDELISAQPVLLDTRVRLFNLIKVVNRNISRMQLPASLGPNRVRICSPFSAAPEYNYQPDNCPPNTIKIGDIPQLLKMFTCSGGDLATCGERQFLSNDTMKTVEAYTSSIQNLLNAFPGMENLVDCQVVKDAFAKILSKHCKPLKKFAKMVWASMVALSTIMVVLVLTWAVKAFHEKSHHFSDGSVKPHQIEVDEKIGADDQTNRKLDP